MSAGEISSTPATLILNAMFGQAPHSFQDAMAVLEAALDALHDMTLDALL